MFIHGREAYRRNSLLILYTFYKNVLYITTQFFFGFWSMFSGQPLYEPFIYQLYNITMTSLPIMYFALFDFQYEKEPSPMKRRSGRRQDDALYFLKHPQLYRIGIECRCFGVRQFLRWDIYGLWHAFVIYMCCFHFLAYPG